MDIAYEILAGEAYSHDSDCMDDGGPACASQMTVAYRLLCTLVCVLFIQVTFEYFVLKYFTGPWVSKSLTKSVPKSPYLIEKIFGVIQIVELLCQIYSKSHGHRLIFLLNPCHAVTLLQAYCLLSKSSGLNKKIFIITIANTWCAEIALLFPTPGNLPLKYDYLLFHAEHYLTGIIVPFLLILAGRYTARYQFNWRAIYFGYQFFTLYQRLVLSNISMLTWANMNFTLCAATTDPFYPTIGNNYYYLAEFYLFILSITSTYLWLSLSYILRPSLFKLKAS
ncbi:unnamed protein product [Blepharisma stoltei]|uniref:Transmembrane protein n=1 Tax=Blepharisma stoltei TaxID=1481888 RepID=A0AAU9JWY2_9CILI|nr:unnamed protein product [Blepharisma stoltei]